MEYFLNKLTFKKQIQNEDSHTSYRLVKASTKEDATTSVAIEFHDAYPGGEILDNETLETLVGA